MDIVELVTIVLGTIVAMLTAPPPLPFSVISKRLSKHKPIVSLIDKVKSITLFS